MWDERTRRRTLPGPSACIRSRRRTCLLSLNPPLQSCRTLIDPSRSADLCDGDFGLKFPFFFFFFLSRSFLSSKTRCEKGPLLPLGSQGVQTLSKTVSLCCVHPPVFSESESTWKVEAGSYSSISSQSLAQHHPEQMFEGRFYFEVKWN